MHSTSSSDALYQHLLAVAAGIDANSGWLRAARQVPSPNFDTRPGGILQELIVMHGISLPPDEFGGPWIDRLFTNTLPPAEHPYFEKIRDLRVSFIPLGNWSIQPALMPIMYRKVIAGIAQ